MMSFNKMYFDNLLKHEKLKLHFAYFVVILMATLIFLVTGAFTPEKNFTEYLANAATLVSVVLGMVAIVYSFISNDSLSKSLGSISNATEQIGQTREQMAVYVERTTDIASSSIEGATIMKSASAEMKNSFQELNSLLSVMHGQTTEFKDVLNQLPLRFDKLEAALQDRKESKENKQKTSAIFVSNKLPDANVEAFINQSSLSTNLLCYALVLAARSKKRIAIKAYCDLIGSKLTGQVIGIVRTMEAINLIDVTELDDYSFEVEQVHRLIQDEIENYFKAYIQANFSDREDRLALWNDRISRVEKAYGNGQGVVDVE